MRILYTAIVSLLYFCQVAFGQCPPPGFPDSGNTCPQAPILCENLDGYCNTINNNNIPQPFPGCSGQWQLNNDEWFAFYAGTTTITIVVTPSNCTSNGGNQGMQGGIYNGCGGPVMAVQCPCTTQPFTLTSNNYVVGQIYWFVLDGCGGDVCDYSIDVTVGSTVGQPPAPPGDITGPTPICAGATGTYAVPVVTGATQYTWTLNPNNAGTMSGGNDHDVNVAWSNNFSGDAQLCLMVANACYPQPDTQCYTVHVVPKPTAVLSGSGVLCQGAGGSVNLTVTFTGEAPWVFTPKLNGVSQAPITTSDNPYTLVVTQPGTWTIGNLYPLGLNNCPGTTSGSVVISQVNVVPTSTTVAATCGQSNGSVNLSVTGGNNPYAFNWSNGAITEDLANVPPGSYTVTVTDNNNCTATHTVTVIDNQIVLVPSAVTSPNTVCNVSYNGSINLSVSPAGSYTYNWSNGATTEDLSNQPPGTYTVTITSGINCTATGSYTINDTPNNPSATYTTVGTTCELANGSINLSVSGGVMPYTFSWSNGATSEDLSNILAGTYAVTVTGANGCTATADITVINTNPPINITNTVIANTNCNGIGNGSIDVSVSPAGSYTYNWSNGASSQDLSGLLPGTYSLTVTGQGVCSATADFTVADNPLKPTVTFTTVQSICELANGSVNVSVSGGVSPYTFLWSNGATTEDLSSILAGLYMVTVTGANGCTAEANINVANNNPPITVSANIMGNTTCDGNYNGAISATASPAGAYTYLWSTGATTTNINNLPAGDYTITVTGQGACSQVQTFTVPENANVPLVATSAIKTTCDLSNGSISVTVNGSVPPFTFNWSSGQTTQNLASIPAGSYIVTVTAANGCTTVAVVDVPNFNPPFLVNANVLANTTCINGNGSIDVSVTPAGNYTYTWSNGASTQDLTNLLPGDYTVTVSAGGSCVEVVSYHIADNPNTPNLSFNHVDPNCGLNNGSINLSVSGGVLPYTYIWSNGVTAQDLNNIPSEIYIVTVTGANGCSSVDGVVLSDYFIPVSIEGFVTGVTSCVTNNGTIALVVTPALATILWDNNSSSPTRNNLAPGLYSVTVSAGGVCTETATFEIYEEMEYPALSTDIVEAFCSISNGAIDLEINGGITPYSYHWSNNAATQDLANLPQGTYSVTVTSAVGCTAETTVFVPNNDFSIQLNGIIYDNLSCVPPLNGAIDLELEPSGYNYIFKWSNGKTTQNLMNIPPGLYTVTVSLGTTCSAIETYEVLNAAAAPNLSVSGIPAICGLSNGGANLTATGASAPYTYKWSTGATTEDLSNVPPGTYTVTVTDFFDCSATASVVVTNNNVALNVSGLVTQNTSCTVANGLINISVSPAGMFNYNWSNGANTEDVSNLPAGTYTVTVTAGTSCISSATYTVLNNTSDPVITPAITAAICTNPNGAIDLTIGGAQMPYLFAWSNAATTEDLMGLLPGTYSMTVTDANGCTADTILFVPNNSSTFSLAGATQALTDCAANNGAVDLNVTPAGPYTYLWSTGALTQDVSGLDAGIYTVEVTETGTCTASISFIISDNRSYPSIVQTIAAELCDLQNGNIDLAVNGGLMPYVYTWSGGQTTQDLTNISDGNYTVTITGANNCSTTATAMVPDNSVNFAIAGTPSSNTSCVAENGAIDLTMNPADPGSGLSYTFTWSNAAMTEDLSGLSPGQYDVTVSAGGTCTSTANYNVTNNAVAPTITEAITPALCSQNAGSVDVTLIGGQAPYTYLWSTGSILEDLTGIPPGNYSLTVTGANGCTRVKNYVILENVIIPAITPTISSNTSCVSNNGAIVLNVMPALTYNYLWASGETTASLQILPGGSYSVTVSAGGSCTAEASFIVPNNILVVTLNGVETNVLCFGNSSGAIDLTVNGGNLPYSYYWSPTAGNIEDLVNLTAGTYSVTVTDVNGCTSATMFNIAQPANSIQIACAAVNDITNPTATDGMGTVNITGGVAPYTVLWSPGGMQNNVIPGLLTLDNLGQGNFLVTVTDANGCPATCDFIIGLVPCETSVGAMGNTAMTHCGTGCITANYNAIGQYLDANDALQFILHEGSGNQIVNELERSNQATFCYNPATMAYGTTYYISAVAGNADPTGNVIIGAYCTAISAPTPVTFYEKPVAATNQPMPLNCVVRELYLIGSANLPGASFDWSTVGGNIIGNASQANVQVNKAGAYSLIIAVNSCRDTANLFITDISNNPTAIINATPDDLLDCVLDEIILSGNVEGSFDANTVWISGANIYNPGTVLQITDPGTYQFVLLDTLTLCSDTAIIVINQDLAYPPLFLNPPGLLTCLNTSVTLTGGSPFPGISFSWATIAGSDTTLLGNGTSLPVSTAGTYWLFGIDPSNHCTNASDVAVMANQEDPIADAGTGFSIKCFGQTAALDGTASSGNTGALNFLWSTNNGKIVSGASTETPLIGKPGTYLLIVTDPANGCSDTDNVIIDPIDPTAKATVNQPPCYGDKGAILVNEVIGGQPPIRYSLNDGPFTSQANFLHLAAGTYNVVVQDAEGCSTTLSVDLIEPEEFVIIVSPNATISLGDTYQISTQVNVPLSAIQSVQWTPSTGLSCDTCLNLTAMPLASTQYKVEVKTEAGCRDDGLLRLLVRRTDVYIPNVFTPNDDGDNDVFTVFADQKGVRQINYLQVYSRWGELIWERFDFDPNDLKLGWDGTHRGKDLNPAVFVYQAEVEFIDGRKELFKGDVTIVR